MGRLRPDNQGLAVATDGKLTALGSITPQGSFAILEPALAAAASGRSGGSAGPSMEREQQAVISPREGPPVSDQIDGLFRSQAPQLFRFLNRRTRGHEDAADMVQEAFLRLIRLVSLEAFPVSPEAYLQQIAGNLLRDRSRRRAARSEDMHEPLDEESLVDRSPGPADLFSARELLEAYETALGKLAPKTRRIFLLHRREGLTYAKIAAEVGLSVSGVEKHMMKAIAHIDRALGRP